MEHPYNIYIAANYIKYMEKCNECGQEFKDFKGLNVHMKKKHSKVKIDTKRVEIAASNTELEKWKQSAKEHNFPNLSAYVRFMMREGVSGAEQLRKAELENHYNAQIGRLEKDKRKVETELEAMRTFFTNNILRQRSKGKIRKMIKELDKPTKWMLKHFKGFDKDLERLEEQYIGDKLTEEEWNSLNHKQQILVKRLLNNNKIPIEVAIKKIKKKCSKDFESFFKKELFAA
jgi:hypothetical protein